MSDASETELQFLLTVADADRLRGHALLAGPLAEASPQRLIATYFDTPERALAQTGLFLRVRQIGDKYVQTLKQHRPASLERGEWEWPLNGPKPDLSLTNETPLAVVLEALGGQQNLAPQFTVDVERTAVLIAFQRANIEVAFDRGEIHGGGHHLPVNEIEFELKSGPRRGMFGLALKLSRQAQLELSLLSKGERGHLVSAAAWGLPVKAVATPVLAEMRTSEAFSAVCRSCLRQFAGNAPAFAAGNQLEAVHQSRIAIRRLRAALDLFAPAIRDQKLKRFKRDLKWIAAILGQARDLDVMLSQSLKPAPPQQAQSAATQELARSLETMREAAHARLKAALASRKFRKLLLDFALWCENGAWRSLRNGPTVKRRNEPCEHFMARRISKWRKSFAKSVARFDELDEDTLHVLRIKAKKLRYTAEFCEQLARGSHTEKRLLKFLAAIEKFQESVGVIRDMQTRNQFIESHARNGAQIDPRALQQEIDAQFSGSPETLGALRRKAGRQAARAAAVKAIL